MSESSATTLEPETVSAPVRKKTPGKRKAKPPVATTKMQPRYNVILWDDQDHTYAYVIRMMQSLFRKNEQDALLIAEEVNTTGRAICMTTSKEHAELKRDQIHAFGSDPLASRNKNGGSMWSSIEAMPS